MGIDPSDTFTYWLPDDLSKPEGERRGLVYAHRSVRDWRKFQADQKHVFRDGNNIDGLDADLLELLGRGLVRCVNLESLDSLRSKELIAAAGELRRAAWLSDLEKKDSPSPAPSAAANSAPSAKPTNA